MAGSIGNAYINVVPKLEGDANAIGASFGGELAGGLSGAFSAGTVAIGSLIAGMVQAGTQAIGQFVGDTISAGMSFDSAMSQVAATMGITMDEMQTKVGSTSTAFGEFSGTLEEFAQFMGSNTAFSATQAAEALNYMALAGYDAQTSMDMLPNVLNLAAAGGMELANASDMVTDAQSALGLSLEDTSVMVDQMAAAASTTNTSVEQLGSAFLTVGGTAKMMQGGTQELAQVLGLLADNGIKGSEGGTALRNILLSLSAPTDKAKEQIEALGLQVFDAEGNMRDMQSIIGDLGGALDGMTDQERAEAISTIFNKRDLKSVNALLGTSAERWEEVAGAIGDSAGAAQQMADTQLDNLEGDVTLFQSALEGLQIQLFHGVEPALRSVVSFFTEGISGMTETLSGLNLGENMQVALEGMMETMSPYIETLSTFFTELGTNVGGIIEQIVPVITGVLTPAIETAGAILATVGGIVMDVVGAVVEFINSNVMPLVSDIAAVIIPVIEEIAGDIQDKLPGMQSTFESVMGAIGGVVEQVWPVVSSTIMTVVETVANFVKEAWPVVQTVAETVFNGIKGVVEAVWPTIETIITTAVDVISGAIEGISGLVNIVTGIFDDIKAAIEDPITAARDLVEGAIEAIKGFFNFDIQWPHIPLPHFSVSGSPNPLDWLEGGLPSFSIEWYAKGGIVDGATLIGAGERGAELIWPSYEPYMSQYADAIASKIDDKGDIIVNLNYKAGADANEMVRDLARGIKQYRMAGVI